MTTRDKEQNFARLFRLMDSPFEGEALNAFRQARRMLQEESTKFGTVLDHTQQLKDTNTALGEQNRDLNAENEKYRSRSDRLAFARTALGRLGPLSTWLPSSPGTALETNDGGGEVSPDPPRWWRFSWTSVPRDLRTILAIFALIAVTTVSCHMFTSDSTPSTSKSASVGRGWLGRLPVTFSVDRPPWCVACRNHQDHPGAEHHLPTDFSINHPPWCPACRHQQAQPDTDRQRHYGRMF